MQPLGSVLASWPWPEVVTRNAKLITTYTEPECVMSLPVLHQTASTISTSLPKQPPMESDSQKSTHHSWTKADMERLVTWMVENPESLRGKQAGWHKDVKEQVFAQSSEITLNRIRDKAQNMKKAWIKARRLREELGSGARAEDQVATFNALLESKCPLFWKLDEIWGQDATPILLIADSTQDLVSAGEVSTSVQPRNRTMRLRNQTMRPSTSISVQPLISVQPPASMQSPTSMQPPTSVQPLVWLAPQSGQRPTLMQEADPKSGDEELGTPLPKTATASTANFKGTRKHLRDKTGVLHKIMGDRVVVEREKEEKRAKLELEREEKRAKLELEMHKDRMAIEERRLEAENKRFQQQLESQERIMKIQAEAQAKQFESFMRMMSMSIRAQQGLPQEPTGPLCSSSSSSSSSRTPPHQDLESQLLGSTAPPDESS